VRELLERCALGDRATAATSAGALEPLEARAMLAVLPEVVATLGIVTNKVVIADFNGDGQNDIAAWSTPGRDFGTERPGAYRVWWNNNGAFDKAWASPTVASSPYGGFDIEAIDVDSDGRLDLLAGDGKWYRNQGATFVEQPVLAGMRPLIDGTTLRVVSMLPGDAPQVVRHGFSRAEVFEIKNGQATLVATIDGRVHGAGRFADFARDAIVIQDSSSSTQGLLVFGFDADPNGGVSLRTRRLAAASQTTLVADVNEDGRADVFSTQDRGLYSDILLQLQRPDGTLGAPTPVHTVWDLQYDTIFARFAFDANGDGHRDLLIQYVGLFGIVVSPVLAYGDGTGSFIDGPQILDEVVAVGNLDSTIGEDMVRSRYTASRYIVDYFNAQIIGLRDMPTTSAGVTTPTHVVPGQGATVTIRNLRVGDIIPRSAVVFEDVDGDGLVTSADREVTRLTLQGDGTAQWTVALNDWQHVGRRRYLIEPSVGQLGGQGTLPRGFVDPIPVEFDQWTRAFYPEGWRNIANVNEHIPLVNPHPFPVSYRVVARYETGERDQVVFEGVLAPFSRGGVSTALRGDANPLLTRPNEAYAIEVQSSNVLGAMMVRYDTFGIANAPTAAQGEAFTKVSETRWAYDGLSGTSLDFVVLYNPFDATANITLEIIDALGIVYRPTLTIAPFRRGGFYLGFSEIALSGEVAVVVTSDMPIVAGVSSHQPGTGRSMTALASYYPSNVPSTTPAPRIVGPVPLGADGVGSPRLSVFSPNQFESASVTLELFYSVGGSTQRIVQALVIGARSRVSVDLATLAPAGASAVVARLVPQPGNASADFFANIRGTGPNGADTVAGATMRHAGAIAAFADGFLAKGMASSREALSLFNPNDLQTRVTLAFHFPDGSRVFHEVSLAGRSLARLNLHELPVLAGRPSIDWFSTVVHADRPIVASLLHTDPTQGAWASPGQLLGGWALP
jgi:hypothetical protein